MGNQNSLIRQIVAFVPRENATARHVLMHRTPRTLDPESELALLAAATPPYAVFMLGHMTVSLTPFSRTCTRLAGLSATPAQTPAANELVPPGFALDAAHLRHLLNGLALAVRVGCAVTGITSADPDAPLARPSRQQIDRYLAHHGLDDIATALHALFATRDAFVADLAEVERMRYRGNPLGLCFDRPTFLNVCARYDHTPDDADETDFFVEDAIEVTHALLTAYRRDQHRQIDLAKLEQAVEVHAA